MRIFLLLLAVAAFGFASPAFSADSDLNNPISILKDDGTVATQAEVDSVVARMKPLENFCKSELAKLYGVPPKFPLTGQEDLRQLSEVASYDYCVRYAAEELDKTGGFGPGLHIVTTIPLGAQ